MRTDLPERPGPVPLPDDSWDGAPTRTHPHVRRHRLPPRRRVLVLIIAAALVPAIVVPLVLSGEPEADLQGQDPLAGGSPSATASAATPTPVATSGAPIIPATGPAETAVSGTGPGSTFTSLSLEAEAGRLRGAEVVALNGGSGVRFTSPSGEIELEPVEVPTRDRYLVTIVYAGEGDWSVAVRGSANAERVRLAATSGCCASATVEVRISPGGSLSIEPSGGDGPLPIIDRVIIEPS